jgi:hypothetical protein
LHLIIHVLQQHLQRIIILILYARNCCPFIMLFSKIGGISESVFCFFLFLFAFS